MSKISRDRYYMNIALETAKRGTCDRRLVGAVLTHNDRILACGFNGAPTGLQECDSIGHDLINGSCQRAVHAEANALLEIGARNLRAFAAQSMKFSKGFSGITLYCTCSPCRACMGLIINARVQRVVYGDRYVDPTHGEDKSLPAFQMAKAAGIMMEPISLVEP